MDRITLVTGATGHVGTNLVRALCARGERVRITVRPRSRKVGLEGLPLEEVPADLGDPASLAAAAKGVERVFHLAASVRLDPFASAKVEAANVQGTRNVLAAAQAAGVRRFVHCSSVAAIGSGPGGRTADETNVWRMESYGPYFSSKRDAEVEVLRAGQQGLDVVIVNPGMILGPWDPKPSGGRTLLQLARAKLPFYPPGGTGFVGVDDVVEGLLLAMEKGRSGERYILVGENLSYRELMTMVARVRGFRPPRLPLPRLPLAAAGRLGDLAGRRWPKAFAGLNTPMVRGYVEQSSFSSEKAKRELGWRPRPMVEHVERAFAWFGEHGYLK